MAADIKEWLDKLSPGDKVGLFDINGRRFITTRVVEKRMPSGRIVCVGGSVFKSDGYHAVARGSTYADRRIMPVPETSTDKD